MLEQLGVFAKYWQPGYVKTRLARSIGDRNASWLYRGLLKCTLAKMQGQVDQRWLVFTPEGRRKEMQALAGRDWRLVEQANGDLGNRLSVFFDQLFAAGAHRVVVIGSDCPTLPAEIIQQAFVALHENPVVLGPSDDGGYYLIGASQRIPAVFTGIEWSTCRVWQQTITCLDKQRIPFVTLPRFADVDEVSDLIDLRDELARSQHDQPEFESLLSTIHQVLDSIELP